MLHLTVVLAALAAPGPITQGEFAALFKEIVPVGPEKWQLVPWQVDLLAAREKARATRRPLFLWSMNGHPLGCT